MALVSSSPQQSAGEKGIDYRREAEAALISRIIAGDGLTFEGVVRQLSGELHRTAYRILQNHADAEDAVQDSFVRALRKLPDFRHECSLSTWLHAIVTNSARNKYW